VASIPSRLSHTPTHEIKKNKFIGWVVVEGLHMCMTKAEIELFMKGKPFYQLCNQNWMCNFVFLIYSTNHTNELNINLQGANHLVNEVFDKIMTFMMKLQLWEPQLRPNSRSHFPILRTENPLRLRCTCENSWIYVFKVYKKCKAKINLFFILFEINAETVTAKFYT
jgi:hypothetical protein